MIDVSVIIVNYNTYQVTKNCIDSIFEYTSDISIEVILVDNNSQDLSYIKFRDDERIKYLFQTDNLGFGKANNIGYKEARGKYIFLLNSDTLLRSNAIKEFYDYMENSPYEVACIGTLLKDIDGNIIHSYGKFPTIWTFFEWYTVLGCIYRPFKKILINQSKASNIVDYITGADLFIRKDIVNTYGLFDPDFFMYYEETELQFRYHKLGYKCVIIEEPQIIHLENYSMNKVYNSNTLKKTNILIKSNLLYIRKCYSRNLYYLVLFLFYFIHPFYILHPKYKFKDKINFIINGYQ